jgi:hypothetical protein
LLPSIHLTFERLSLSNSRETRQQAAQLLASMEKFEFLVTLQAVSETSGVLIGVSRSLQAEGIDFVRGLNDITTVKEALVAMRQNVEEAFMTVFGAAEKLATDMHVSIEKPRIPRRSVYRSAAVSSTVTEDTDASIMAYYRINMFIPLLDELISHLSYRFGKLQQTALSLMGLIPSCLDDNLDSLQPAIAMYSELLPSPFELSGEFTIWKRKWTSTEGETRATQVNTALAALHDCQGQTLPNIRFLLEILATLPVTTAEPERVFSKVERTATAIRNMDEERLEGLILLQTHLDKTPSIDNVLNKFAESSARR